ncbi:MAG: TlpA disulfide reductase family protein, partial [Oscillospiraceae bacterium]
PDVTIYNSKGEEVSLASLLGKPTVINFWASWCGPCKAELPDFQSVFDEKSKDVNFIMVNLTDGFRETQSRAEKLISSSGYTFPIFFDNDGNASDEYGVYSIPTTFFVNANGEIENIHTGLITKEQLIKEIEDMM